MFNDIFSSQIKNNGIYLGSPEAEGDALYSSRMPLIDAYEDFHGLLDGISHEKFIITGRKGSGKSAFAEYIWLKSEDNPNAFVKFIRRGDFSLEKIVQFGNKSINYLEVEPLYKWIIYVNMLKLFLENEIIKSSKHYNELNKFMQINSGYIDIDEFEIKKLIEKSGFTINISPLKNLSIGSKSEIEGVSEKAEFYKIIPFLEKAIIEISKDTKNYQSAYILFFDDLDLNFNINDTEACNSIVSLLRISKYINNEVFGKNNIKAKIVILLRDDIESYLSWHYADTAKIFSTYSKRIFWIDDPNQSDFENNNLKKFIDKRIAIAFSKANISCKKNNKWHCLVHEKIDDKLSFRYIINNTLCRPRDLLLFFKPLEDSEYSFPLDKKSINTLSGFYVTELAKEIQNEMSAFYNRETIDKIFSVLGELATGGMEYQLLLNYLSETLPEEDPDSILNYLFKRSVIGNKLPNGWVEFKYREPLNSPEPYTLNRSEKVVLQYGIKKYLNMKGFTT